MIERSKVDQEIILKAKKWLSTKIDIDNIGRYFTLVEGSKIIFYNFKDDLSVEDIFKVCQNSSDVFRVWWGKDQFEKDLRISYTNQNYETFKEKELNRILKREWFILTLRKMKSNGYYPQATSNHFAEYAIYNTWESKLNIDLLESSTGKSFEFERHFNKPKNKIHATIEI